MNERFVAKRFWNIFFMLFLMIIFTVAIGIKEQLWIDQMLCLILLDFVFFLILLFLLEFNRDKKAIASNRETNYAKTLSGFIMMTIAAFGCSFFPEYVKPVIILPFLVASLGNVEIAFCTSSFFAVIIAIATEMQSVEIVLVFLMILLGSMLSKALENIHNRLWCSILILCLSVMLPEIFFYLFHQQSDFSIVIWGLAEGIVVGVFVYLFYDKLRIFREKEVKVILEDVLEKEYPLAKELRKFSKKEYIHGRRVSDAARACARVVGCDEQICAVAAFYYRIGIIDGDNIAENGVRIAEKYCFPEEVIKIINEYYGTISLPSTIESAIVQMCDGVIKKLEVLDQTTMSSNWNQDMVIYQTLNEFSAQGMYDEAGLSMNRFLKIREYLVNKDALL